MLNPEVPRKVLLVRWRDPDDQHWVYALYTPIGQPLVGTLQDRYSLRRDDDSLVVVDPNGQDIGDLTTAVAQGAVLVDLRETPREDLRTSFQSHMRIHVWRSLNYWLARSGEDPAKWILRCDDDGLYLCEESGRKRSRIANAEWWLTEDPDAAHEMARELLDSRADEENAP